MFDCIFSQRVEVGQISVGGTPDWPGASARRGNGITRWLQKHHELSRLSHTLLLSYQ